MRLFHRVLIKRLSVLANYEFQAGFNAGRGTSENVFLLKRILWSRGKSRRSLTYVTFLDFRKAFDSVNHLVMLDLLEDIELPTRLIGYLKSLYSRVKLTLGGDWFEQGRGVLQGDPLSPTLFNLIIDYILAGLNKHLGVLVEGKFDLLLMASSREGLDANLKILVQRDERVGLTLGLYKCATTGSEWFVHTKKPVGDYRPFLINNQELTGTEFISTEMWRSAIPVLNHDWAHPFLMR